MDTISPLEMAWRTSCEWHLSTMRKWCKDLINRWSSNIWSIDSSLLAVWKAFKNLRLLGITSLFGKNPNKRGRWIQAILTSPSRRKHPKIAWEGADSSPFPKHFVGTDIPYQLPNPYQLVSRKIRVARLLSLQDGRCANIVSLRVLTLPVLKWTRMKNHDSHDSPTTNGLMLFKEFDLLGLLAILKIPIDENSPQRP